MREEDSLLAKESERKKNSSRRIFPLLLIPLLFWILTGCATTPVVAPVPQSAPTLEDIPDLETRALLLLLGDRRLYEPVAIRNALDSDQETRRRLALTLGNLGDSRGLPMLEALLVDDSTVVRRTAIFALGEMLEDRTSAANMALGLVNDTDRRTGVLAVEALARLGVTLSDVATRLQEGDPEELLPRLLPALFRFRSGASPEEEEAIRQWAEQGLKLDDPALRGLAEEAASTTVPNAASLPLLRSQLDDSDAATVIEALRATRRLLIRGLAAPPSSWRPRLMELLDDARPGVRVTAIEASASWLLDESLSARLTSFARDGHVRERELALLALTEGGDPEAAPLIAKAASDPDPRLRAAAAVAADLLGEFDLLRRLRRDPSPQVRVASWLALMAYASPEEFAALAREALADEDLAVRATVLARLQKNPVLEMDALLDALRAGARDRMPTARIAAVAALGVRGLEVPQERDAILAALEQLGAHHERLVRLAAAEALLLIDGEPFSVGSRKSQRDMATWREIVLQTSGAPRLEVVTDRGTFTVELACSEAPLHCLNFLQLARQGFYDDLVFHRVNPGIAVHTGDPRGDGWGGPGYTLRDEKNLLRFRRGVLGMALDGSEAGVANGSDTGGSRFFITLSEQPRLDGTYTAFGRVVSGIETVDKLLQGDRILQVRVLNIH